MTTAERLTTVAENVAKVYEAGKAAAGPGFTPPTSDALDPDEVYRTTRPADWLPMPIPGDDEIYLLGHIPEGLDGAFTAQIAHGGNCVVEFGNLVNGEFVAKESITPTNNVRFFHTLYASNYGDVTSDGYTQYLVRIAGDFTRVVLYNDSNGVAWSHGAPMLVDAIVGTNQTVVFGYNGTTAYNCEYLRYVRYVGIGTIGRDSTMMFRGCARLMSVSAESEALTTSMNYAFSGCSSLIAISGAVLPSGATYSNTFNSCPIPALPQKTFKPKTSVGAMFRNAGALMRQVDFRYIDTSDCTDLSYLAHSSGLKIVRNLNISSATNIYGAFDYCRLIALTFAGDTTPGGWTLDLTSTKMTHKALVNMINSLPTATAAATLTITGNPGASELTDDEIAVATARNWTITI